MALEANSMILLNRILLIENNLYQLMDMIQPNLT